MNWFFSTVRAHLTGKATAGRNVLVCPDDIFITSFPRSGNTWTRFLIGNLVYADEPVTFANVESKVPDIYVNSQAEMMKLPRPRILKSHEAFDPRYPKVIYIVRDPRDVAVSTYHYKIKRRVIGDDYPMDRFVERFVLGEFTAAMGSWGQNVISWLATRQSRQNFLLLRYEDMVEDTKRELRKIAGFLGIESGDERLSLAVERSSASTMRELEKKQSLIWKRTATDRQDKPFVRAATAGSWQSELSSASILEIEKAWGRIMRVLGYLLVNENVAADEDLVKATEAR
jgi:hypothetical protein